MQTHDVLHFLGRDHLTFGSTRAAATASGRTAAAISPGARPDAPSMASKGDRRIPNEDAVLTLDAGPRTLLAVADAHWGHQASHLVVDALAAHLGSIPGDPAALRDAVAALPLEPAGTRSRTTLTVCVVDREAGRGFGLNWGDSSVVTTAADGTTRQTMPGSDYVVPPEIPIHRARAFGFDLRPGDLVVAFTDGIDQCHYRSPSTSVGPEHVTAVAAAAGGEPERFVRDLARRALAGVDGHPGGQDNLVIAATRV